MVAKVRIADAKRVQGAWQTTLILDCADGVRTYPQRYALPLGASEGDLLDQVKADWASVPDMTAWRVPATHRNTTLAGGQIYAGPHVVVDDKLAGVTADVKPWSFQATSSGHRFELRPGDVGEPNDPATSQRSELISRFERYRAGHEVWSSWTTEINIPDGFEHIEVGRPNWGLIAQWHSVDTLTGRSPVVGFDYGNNAFRVVTRSDAEYSNGFAVEKVRFSDSLPVGPVNYVCRFVLGQAGELQVWRAGVEIVNIAAPIGYYNDIGDLAYLLWGIYRRASEFNAAVTTSNMRWGLTDLSDKILNPDPV